MPKITSVVNLIKWLLIVSIVICFDESSTVYGENKFTRIDYSAEQISACLLGIIENHFIPSSLFIVSNQTNISNYLREEIFLQQTNIVKTLAMSLTWVVSIFNDGFPNKIKVQLMIHFRNLNSKLLHFSSFKTQDNVFLYLIFVNQLEELSNILPQIQYTIGFQYNAKTIIRINDVSSVDLQVYLNKIHPGRIPANLLFALWNRKTAFIEYFRWIRTYQKLCTTSYATITKIGNCSQGISNVKADLAFQKMKLHFNGCLLTVGAVSNPPFVAVVQPHRNSSSRKLRGVEVNIIETIAMKMKLNIKFNVYGDKNDWGIVYSKNNITGMLAGLLNREIDFAIGSVELLPHELEFVDVSNSYMQVNLACVFVIKKND